MAKFLVLLILFISLSVVAADKTYGSAVVDSIISVYDGDTFRCNIKGYPPIIGENMSVRVRGIDTPEIRSKSDSLKILAVEVRDYVKDKLVKAEIIILKDVARPKYFRLLADVIIDGKDLGKELIDKGYACPYDGGTKTCWQD